MEFVDLHEGENDVKRPYAKYIKRCNEMETNIERIQQEMKKYNLPIKK